MTREETVRLLRRDNWGAPCRAPARLRRKTGSQTLAARRRAPVRPGVGKV